MTDERKDIISRYWLPMIFGTSDERRRDEGFVAYFERMARTGYGEVPLPRKDRHPETLEILDYE